MEQRRRHQPARDVPRSLGDVTGEAWVVPDVLEDERSARRQHPARDAVLRGEAHAEERLLAFAHDCLEYELVGRLVE